MTGDDPAALFPNTLKLMKDEARARGDRLVFSMHPYSEFSDYQTVCEDVVIEKVYVELSDC